MRPYERYALVALLFLVTVVVVGVMWDDGSSPDPETDTVAAAERPDRVVEDQDVAGSYRADQNEANSDRGERIESMPLAGSEVATETFDRVSTRMTEGRGHSVQPGALDPRPAAPKAAPPQAETLTQGAQAQEPFAGTLKPERIYGDDRKDAIGDAFRSDRRFLPRDSAATPTRSETASTTRRDVRPADRPDAKAPKAEKVGQKTTPASQPSGDVRRYVVKSGDALSRIASKECGTKEAVAQIVSLNGLSNPDKISVGMTLILPPQTSAKATVQPKVAAADSGGKKTPAKVLAGADGRPTVKVGKGDVLSALLERELGTYSRSIRLVKELNPGLNPDRVVVGQTIILPHREELPADAVPSRGRRSAPKDISAPKAPRVASNGVSANRDSKYVVR